MLGAFEAVMRQLAEETETHSFSRLKDSARQVEAALWTIAFASATEGQPATADTAIEGVDDALDTLYRVGSEAREEAERIEGLLESYRETDLATDEDGPLRELAESLQAALDSSLQAWQLLKESILTADAALCKQAVQRAATTADSLQALEDVIDQLLEAAGDDDDALDEAA